ncbi:MAG TPA: hypothetical protein VMV05_11440 [bacterium]|nr:hypothetical protein [bacterium]
MKQFGYSFAAALGLTLFLGACGSPTLFLPAMPTATPTPSPSPTPFAVPTTTPGCYSANSLPVTQYTVPNPAPTATPFGTPVVAVETPTAWGYEDNGSHGTVLLRSASDWTLYWTDCGLPVPPAPVDFTTMMVLVPGGYSLGQICYTPTNIIVDQGTGSGGAQIYFPLTPVPTPSTLQKAFCLVPASSLPVSFNSTYIYYY